MFAPDSFKGSLTSIEVARALAAGWKRARPDDGLVFAPLADGGEGTLTSIEFAGGWERRSCAVTDPIGRPVSASWLRSSDGTRAFVELAEASGLSRLTPDERDPMGASTHGTGEVLMAVLDAGVTRITLGIGGSATNDGGAGILRAIGARIDDAAISLDGMDPRLASVELRIACDVSNPLLGPSGVVTHRPCLGRYGPNTYVTSTTLSATQIGHNTRVSSPKLRAARSELW